MPTIINFNSSSGEQQIIKGFPGINKFASLLNIAYKTEVAKVISATTNFFTCGNGIVEAGEQCDDGGTTGGDGCSATCTIETGFTCVGMPSVCTTTCGDGIVAGSEQCDDGNAINGDGCNNSCSVEPGFICTGTPSVCTSLTPSNDECNAAISLTGIRSSVLGNNSFATNSAVAAPSCQVNWQKDMWYSFIITGPRPVTIAVNGITMTDPLVAIYTGTCGALTPVGCDDDSGPGNFSLYTGNLAAGTYYIRVLGYGTGTPGQGSFSLDYNLNGICGNGLIEYSEECDDGNLNNGDGCSSTCAFENATGAKGVSVNEDGVRANPSSMMDIKSDYKGLLIPRLTTAQRSAIATPAKGLIVFDLTSNSFWYYKTSAWSEISSAFGTGFSAFNGSSQAFTGQFLSTFPVEQYDDGNNFSTDVFVAPVFAIYDLSCYASFTFTSTVAQSVISLSIENTITSSVYATNSIIVPAGFSGLVKLNTAMSSKINAGSRVGVRVLVSGTPGTQQLSSITFSGYKVY